MRWSAREKFFALCGEWVKDANNLYREMNKESGIITFSEDENLPICHFFVEGKKVPFSLSLLRGRLICGDFALAKWSWTIKFRSKMRKVDYGKHGRVPKAAIPAVIATSAWVREHINDELFKIQNTYESLTGKGFGFTVTYHPDGTIKYHFWSELLTISFAFTARNLNFLAEFHRFPIKIDSEHDLNNPIHLKKLLSDIVSHIKISCM